MAEMAIAIDVPVGRRGWHDIGRCPMSRGSWRISILCAPIVSFKDMIFSVSAIAYPPAVNFVEMLLMIIDVAWQDIVALLPQA